MAKELTDRQFDNELYKIENQSNELKPIKKSNKTKEITNMKKSMNKTTIAVLLSIAVTLVTIAAFALTFYYGVQYESNRQANVAIEASKLVEQLKSQE